MEVITEVITDTIIIITPGITTAHSIMVIIGVLILITIAIIHIFMVTGTEIMAAVITEVPESPFIPIPITGQGLTVRPKIYAQALIPTVALAAAHPVRKGFPLTLLTGTHL